jgi:hypothetical protein
MRSQIRNAILLLEGCRPVEASSRGTQRRDEPPDKPEFFSEQKMRPNLKKSS